jgi:hypothetical protein
MGTPSAWLSFLWYFCVHTQLEMGIVGRSALHVHFFGHLFCYHRPAAVSCGLGLRAGSPAHGGGAPVRHGLKSATSPPPICCFVPCLCAHGLQQARRGPRARRRAPPPSPPVMRRARRAPPRALHRPLALFPLCARVFWRGARLHLRRGAPVRAGAGLDVLLPRRRARAHRFLRLLCLVSALSRSLCGCYARRRRRCGQHGCWGSRRPRSCRRCCGRCSCNCPCGGTSRAAKQGQVRAGLEATAPRCCCCCCCCSCSCCCLFACPSVIASAAALAKTRALCCYIPGSRCWISCSTPRCGAFFFARGSGASQKEAVGPIFWWQVSGISGARPAPRLSSTARAVACGRCAVIPRSLRRAATRIRRSISCRTIPGCRCWISCSKPRCGAFFFARGSGVSQKEAVAPIFWWQVSGISGARPAPRLSSTARAAACWRCTAIPRSLRRAATRIRRSIHATEPAAPIRPLLSARKPAQRCGRGAFHRRFPRASPDAACGGAAL